MKSPDPTRSTREGAIGPDLPLLFMHIPKTGGMSLFAALTERFGPAIADLYNVSPRNAAVALEALNSRSKSVYCGHYAFGLHEWMHRPAAYAAIVREPVSRMVSLYHYCRPMLADYAEKLRRAGGDLASFWADLKSPDFYLDFESCLRGDLSPESFFSSPSAELDNGMVRRFSGWGLNPQPCPRSALELAKRNIELHFSAVGVLERYADTLRLMSAVLGFESLAERKVNLGPRESKSPMPQALLERIREMNALDTELYEWICARFDATLSGRHEIKPVQPGGRSDPEGMPLWRSVGHSFERDLGTGTADFKPVQLIHLAQAAYTPQFMQIDAVTAVPDGGRPTEVQYQRLILAPAQARTLLDMLSMTVDAYEAKHGPIKQPVK